MSKHKKATAETRLAKLLKDQESFREHLQMITSPALFDFIEQLCKGYLSAAKFDPASRDLISRFAFAFRQEAFAKFGHDTLETFALGKLLQQFNKTFVERQGRLDALSFINGAKQKSQRLSAEQMEAAEYIIKVWDAFGKFRMIGARSMDGGGGGGKGVVMQPLDVMGDDLWKHYKEIYAPWYTAVTRIVIPRLRGDGNISMAAIMFKVFIEDYYPEQLDGGYGLCRGETMLVIKAGLDHYWDVPRLLAWDEGRRAARGARTAAQAQSKARLGKSSQAA